MNLDQMGPYARALAARRGHVQDRRTPQLIPNVWVGDVDVTPNVRAVTFNGHDEGYGGDMELLGLDYELVRRMFGQRVRYQGPGAPWRYLGEVHAYHFDGRPNDMTRSRLEFRK